MNALINAFWIMAWAVGIAFFVGITVGLPLLILRNTLLLTNLRRRVTMLERELQLLAKPETTATDAVERRGRPLAAAPPPLPDPPAQVGAPSPQPAPLPSKPDAAADLPRPRWRRLETQLLENWTGVLGVGAIVAGVAFVAVSAVSVMQPLLRFLALEGVCLAMAVPSLIIRDESRFRQLSLWLRSGAGGLHLFATAAASTWPLLGLQWVGTTWLALTLLGFGIGLNLFLAQIAPTAWLAATHVLICLAPLTAAVPTTDSSLLITAIALIGLWSPAGREGPTRAVITITFLMAQLWILVETEGVLGSGRVDGGIATAIACSIPVLELWVLHGRRTPERQGSLGWPKVRAATAWISLLCLLQVPSWGGLALVAAAAAAGTLSRLPRLPSARQLVLLDWCAALGLSIAAATRWITPMDPSLLLTDVLILLSGSFLVDALQRRDGVMTRLSGAGVLCFDAVALIQLLNGRGSSIDLVILMATGLAQQWLIRRIQAAPGSVWICRGMALAGVGLPTLAIYALNSAALDTVQTAALSALLLLSLGMARWPRPVPLHRRIVVAIALLIWLKSWGGLLFSNVFNGEAWTISDLSGTVLPMLLLAIGISVASEKLSGSIWRERSLGLVMATATVGLGGGVGQAVLTLPPTGLMPLAWLLLVAVLVLLADRGLKRGLDGEADVLLALAWTTLGCFGFSRFLQQPASLNPFVLALVDGAGVGTLLLLRAGPGHSPLLQRPFMAKGRAIAADLALFGLMLSLLSRFPLDWVGVVSAGLALLLWRLPHERLWPRQRVQGVLLYWFALWILAWGAPTLLPLQLGSIALPVIALCNYPRQQRLDGAPASGALAPLASLDRWVAQHPQRFLATPLSLAVVLALLQGIPDSRWLTLIWAVEALVLYSLSIVFQDRPLRLSALALLGLCLLRLVGWDMRRADMALRGLVFSGVGVVMVTMNVLTTRFERKLSGTTPAHRINER